MRNLIQRKEAGERDIDTVTKKDKTKERNHKQVNLVVTTSKLYMALQSKLINTKKGQSSLSPISLFFPLSSSKVV